jgi:tetratricopeptide (TPR) repeat protein
MADREPPVESPEKPPEPIKISMGEMRFVAASEPRDDDTAPERRAKTRAATIVKAFPRIPWKRIEDSLSALRSFTLTALLLGSLLAVIAFTAAELRRDVVVIDPIRLPESLKKMGYSEEVAALRLWDAVAKINAATPTVKDRVALLPATQRVDFEAPGAGMSMQTIVRMMRRFLDVGETRIAGEFICESEACEPQSLALRLRVFRNEGMEIIYLPPVGELSENKEIDRYFENAALELLRQLDPYVVAFYLYQTDKAAAEREAVQLIGPTDPQLKWALNLLGLIANSKGDYAAAQEWYRRAAIADPGSEFSLAYINWGDTLLQTGDHKGAIAKYKRAAELDPESTLAVTSWGVALMNAGDFGGAISKFARAAEISPLEASIYNSWGAVLARTNDQDGAIEKFRLASELAPNDPQAHFNWGYALKRKGDFEAAAVKFARVVELDPQDAMALNEWGSTLRRIGDMEGAIAKFQRAAEVAPEDSSAFNNWGDVLGVMGDLEGAIAQFAHAREINPKDPKVQLNYAIALKMLGKPADAADAFERFLDLRPDAANADQVRAEIAALRASVQTD